MIDEETAPIVSEMFSLLIAGTPRSRIAKILNERRVLTPFMLYKSRHPELSTRESTGWSCGLVTSILTNPMYIGTLIRNKCVKKSYKDHRKNKLPPSEWFVFENKHSPIIDKETFETAQKLCNGRRKPSKMGEPGSLNGLLYCGDCGHKMHISQTRSRPRSCHYFICSKYRSDDRPVSCTAHRIQIDIIEELAVRELRTVIGFAINDREEFIAKISRIQARQPNKN